MNVSAVNINSSQVRFGNQYKEKESHWFSGGIIGAAAGAAAGKFLPVMKPEIAEGDVDAFISTYKTLQDKRTKKEDKEFLKSLNEVYTEDYQTQQLFKKFGFRKNAKGEEIKSITLYDLVIRNTNPNGQKYVLSQRHGINEHEIDFNNFDTKEFNKGMIENEVNYFEGEIRKLEEALKKSTDPDSKLVDIFTIKENLEKSKEALMEKRFVLSIAEKADNEGNIAKESVADLFKKRAAELLNSETKLGCNIHRQRLSVIIKDLNLTKIKVMGAIGLIGGAIIGTLIKTEKPEGRK